MIIDSFKGKYGFLSNFYENVFEWNGNFARTSEHHFQAAKATNANDAFRVRTAATPGIAKKWGREVPCREDWQDIKLGVMKSILIEKFAIPDMRRRLVSTGDAELIEGNTWDDTFWGVCKCKGENHLGRILMEVRHGYRNNP